MSGKPQLLYFGIPGRGEIVRLLYKHAGVEFVDKRIPCDIELFAKEYKSKSRMSYFLSFWLLTFCKSVNKSDW